MVRLLRLLFFAVIVRPVLLVVLGINVRHREKLPVDGPAIIVANHNSHLDTLTLMSLFPLRDLPKIAPVAALDYFMKPAIFRWFALNIIGILPINRAGMKSGENPLASSEQALDEGRVLILFPEGTRGEPEALASFKKGIAHLAKARPHVPVIPVFMHGLGKALPRGSWVLVPFNCDVFVGESFQGQESIEDFMAVLETRLADLAHETQFPVWE